MSPAGAAGGTLGPCPSGKSGRRPASVWGVVRTAVATPRHPTARLEAGSLGLNLSFRFALAGMTLAGVASRLWFTAGWTLGTPARGDASLFQQAASNLAGGKGYALPFLGSGRPVPTALHPPLFPSILALLDSVGLGSPDDHRIVLAVVSSGAVVATGLLGRRVAGPAAGLLSAAIAALSPLWVQPSGMLMSESVYLVVVPTMLLIALRCLEHPTLAYAGLLGVTIGLAALTRSEGLAFAVVLGVPVVLLATRRWSRRGTLAAALLVGLAAVLGPWIVRNQVQLGGLALTTDEGGTLAGSYSAATLDPQSPYYGGFHVEDADGAAAVIVKWSRPPADESHWTEVALSRALERSARSFAFDHLLDLPGVVLAREGRAWGVFAPGPQLQFDLSDGHVRSFDQAGQVLYWVLLPVTVLGVVVLARRSWQRFVVVAAPLVVVMMTVGVFYGSTRMRVTAEPSLAAFAAAGVMWLVATVRARQRRVACRQPEVPGPVSSRDVETTETIR
jgi:hypothetical protein